MTEPEKEGGGKVWVGGKDEGLGERWGKGE